jgi:23S rRNA pseudouridine2457 synthase
MIEQHRYFAVYKPYKMVSQFVSPEKVRLLGDLNFDFPEGTHAIGRLDANSEGLLLLTTNKKITRLLFMSTTPHKRTYLVRVNGIVAQDTVEQMMNGVDIVVDKGDMYRTMPCLVETLTEPPSFLETFQLETRPMVPHTWLYLSLYEGKYHQVRKMVHAMHHPCRRLIRTSIEDMNIQGMHPGDVWEVSEQNFFSLLKLES